MPPAFVLSQDQTLRKINYFIRKSDSKHLKLCCFDYIGLTDVSNWIFKVTSHYSIFNQLLLFVASHNISFIVSLVKRTFEDFWDFLSTAVLQRPESFKTACDLIYHKNWFCQTQFLIFFDFFISLFCCLLNPGGAKRDIIYHPKLICQMIFS